MSEVSIASLQAFRAVARCGSFTAAANDLECAQSAISRHVASLEKCLQHTLVLRGHRRVQLTTAGELYLETVTRALEELEHGAMRVARASGAAPSVKILAMPSFAARWLVPRLARLHLSGVDVEIDLATSIWDADFHKERFDLAIHYGDGTWPGAQLLMHDSLVPVASPSLLGQTELEQLADLARFPWLHNSLRSSNWSQWLAACNMPELASTRTMRLQDTNTTLTAAEAGLGIAIGHGALVEHGLSQGHLTQVWPLRVPLAAGYHLIQSKRSARNHAARMLVEWLMEEVAPFRRLSSP